MIDDILLEAIDKMDKAVEHAQSQFSTVRTGRATPALVEKLPVNYYGLMCRSFSWLAFRCRRLAPW